MYEQTFAVNAMYKIGAMCRAISKLDFASCWFTYSCSSQLC